MFEGGASYGNDLWVIGYYCAGLRQVDLREELQMRHESEKAATIIKV